MSVIPQTGPLGGSLENKVSFKRLFLVNGKIKVSWTKFYLNKIIFFSQFVYNFCAIKNTCLKVNFHVT